MSPAGETPATSTAPSFDSAFFGHPRGLSTLFFTEFWERFSYYGMRALLILFMTAPIAAGGLAFDTAKAGSIYGAYTALVYLASVPGGWLADRFLGQRRATLYGGVVIMLGHISLAVPTVGAFYLGLILVISGTGLLKPNVSTMVGQLYAPEDRRRDAGFSLYYMGINLGASVSPFLTGWLAQAEPFQRVLGSIGLTPEYSWHWGFAMAAVGMFFGLLQYLAGWKYLGEAGMEPVPPESPEARMHQRFQLQAGLGIAFLVALVLVVLIRTGRLSITPELISLTIGYLLIAVVVGTFAWLLLSRGWTASERKRLLVILVLFAASSVFWALYEQAGSTLNLFAQRNTENALFGWSFPPSWFQAVPPIFVITMAPAFAWFWLKLGPREPSSPAKFVLGLVFVSAGFAVLMIPAASSAKASPLWLVLTYFLHVVGEMCLSPIGLSATTRLAPTRVQGLMMGVWFLSISVGSYLGGRVASLYEAYALPTLFGVVAACALLAAVVLALLLRPIDRMMGRA